MIVLPEDFKSDMKALLGSEYDAFIASYDEPRTYGLRINTLKADKDCVGEIPDAVLDHYERISWSENGYYYGENDRPGKHPLHEAGAYYIQEPSAMLPAEMFDIEPGMKILDMCAAPGGKTTRLAERLAGTGIIVANEYVASRAKILASNVERCGITNAVVINETPQSVEEHFREFFDCVMVDAPCSGEGMFRKNPEAIEEWSEDNVALCVKRQREILGCAYQTLKPGGQMVYSTCTFAIEENENNIEWFVSNFPDMKVEKMERIYPHRQRGEGHFSAKLVKTGEPVTTEAVPEKKSKKQNKKGGKKNTVIVDAINAYEDFAAGMFKSPVIGDDRRFELFGDRLFSVPDVMPPLKGLHVERAGLELGSLLKNRFEPAHALAMAGKAANVNNAFELGKKAEDYIHGEVVYANEACGIKNGWVLMTTGGISLGWGKSINGQIKNHYPKGLRK